MANILHVAGWFDPSGDVTRSVKELNKHSKHQHEALVKWKHPMADILQFPEPEGQSRDNAYVNERFAWADAIIYHLVGWDHPLGYMMRECNRKPVAFRNANVMYDHSRERFYCFQEFFANPGDSAYRMVGSCHMGAQHFMGPRVRFLPALMDIWDTLYMPAQHKKTPAVAFIKDHDILSEEILKLTGEGLLPLRNLPHSTVMIARKRLATIAIDNLSEGHYGLAGTEALAQGIPTIAWNHPITLAQLDGMAGSSPFLPAKNAKEAAALAVRYRDNAQLNSARKWIENYYDSKVLIAKYWEPFVDELITQS